MNSTLVNTFGIDIIPQNDAERLKALYRYQILDTPPEEAFTNLAHLVANSFDVPIALISLVDADRVFFKGNVGMPGVKNVARGLSLCSLAVLSSDPTVIENPLEDPCLMANPLVHGEFGLRFYAGAPIVTQDGYNIGTVCIVDKKERTFSKKDREQLVRFAKVVMHEIEQRLTALQQVNIHKMAAEMLEGKVRERTKELQDANERLKRINTELEQFTYVSHHDLQEPLRKIMLFTDRVKLDGYDYLPDLSKKHIDKISDAAHRMSVALKDVLNFAALNKEEQFDRVDLNEVLISVKTELEMLMNDKQVTIVSSELPSVYAIP